MHRGSLQNGHGGECSVQCKMLVCVVCSVACWCVYSVNAGVVCSVRGGVRGVQCVT